MLSCTGKEQLWFMLVGMPPKATSVTLGLGLAESLEPASSLPCGDHTEAESSGLLVSGLLQAPPFYVSA